METPSGTSRKDRSKHPGASICGRHSSKQCSPSVLARHLDNGKGLVASGQGTVSKLDDASRLSSKCASTSSLLSTRHLTSSSGNITLVVISALLSLTAILLACACMVLTIQFQGRLEHLEKVCSNLEHSASGHAFSDSDLVVNQVSDSAPHWTARESTPMNDSWSASSSTANNGRPAPVASPSLQRILSSSSLVSPEQFDQLIYDVSWFACSWRPHSVTVFMAHLRSWRAGSSHLVVIVVMDDHCQTVNGHHLAIRWHAHDLFAHRLPLLLLLSILDYRIATKARFQ